MRFAAAALVAVLGLSYAIPVHADEVLEAARKEKARREAAAKKKGKTTSEDRSSTNVVSNRNLKKAGGEGPGRLSQEKAEGSAATGAGGGGGNTSAANVANERLRAKAEADKADKAAKGDSGGSKQDESFWRGKLSEANAAVENARKDVQDLNEKINNLRRESASVDDPNIRMRKTAELTKAESELPQVQKKVEEAQKGVDAVREEARRAGAPAGWLR